MSFIKVDLEGLCKAGSPYLGHDIHCNFCKKLMSSDVIRLFTCGGVGRDFREVLTPWSSTNVENSRLGQCPEGLMESCETCHPFC